MDFKSNAIFLLGYWGIFRASNQIRTDVSSIPKTCSQPTKLYLHICIPKQNQTTIKNLGGSYSSVWTMGILWWPRSELNRCLMIFSHMRNYHLRHKAIYICTPPGSRTQKTSPLKRICMPIPSAGHLVGRVRLELTTRSFAWNFEVTLVLAISLLREENIQSIFSFLPALPTELSPHFIYKF